MLRQTNQELLVYIALNRDDWTDSLIKMLIEKFLIRTQEMLEIFVEVVQKRNFLSLSSSVKLLPNNCSLDKTLKATIMESTYPQPKNKYFKSVSSKFSCLKSQLFYFKKIFKKNIYFFSQLKNRENRISFKRMKLHVYWIFKWIFIN